MGDSFIDIIFFAMIAAFLVLRLRGVLGRRDGHEGNYPDPLKREPTDDPAADDTVVHLPDRGKPAAANDADGPEPVDTGPEDTLNSALREIIRADPSFDAPEFVSGARIAFELILGAYAAGDSSALKPLLSPEVFSNFSKVIHDREQAGEVMEDTLVGITAAEIVEANMEGRIASITIKFVTDQVNVTRDENGDVVDGNANTIAEVTDFWTFARDLKSSDPNWALVATRSLD